MLVDAESQRVIHSTWVHVKGGLEQRMPANVPEILKSLAIANLVADDLNYCAARPTRVALYWTNHGR